VGGDAHPCGEIVAELAPLSRVDLAVDEALSHAGEVGRPLNDPEKSRSALIGQTVQVVNVHDA
jgi:hypothetical protein